jgi:hypothetical protein
VGVHGPWALVPGGPSGIGEEFARQAAATGEDPDSGLVLSNAGAMNAPGWQRHGSEPLAEVPVNDKQEIR